MSEVGAAGTEGELPDGSRCGDVGSTGIMVKGHDVKSFGSSEPI